MAKHRDKINKKHFTIIEEFKKFILRGNVIDLAVGVIIGGAFNKIVTSLVNDIIMPLLSVIIGQISFESRFVALDGNNYASMEAAANASVPVLKYGSFLSTALDFLLMSLVIFFMMKGLNFLHEKLIKEKDTVAPVAPAAPATKTCPHCISEINAAATACPFCTRPVEAGASATPNSNTAESTPPA